MSYIPAWLSGQSANKWISIAGTSGGGGAVFDNFCGMTYNPDECSLNFNAASGHDVWDNRCVSLNLKADVPAWVVRTPSSPAPNNNQAYNADGKPAGRHVYQHNVYVPLYKKIFMMGAMFVYGDAGPPEFQFIDAWNPATNQWETSAAGGWGSVTPGYYGTCVDGDGNVWSVWGIRKWIASTKTWTNPFNISSPPLDGVRWPYAYDSLRKKMFGLCYGNGMGDPNAGMRSKVFNSDGTGTQQNVTFNPSSALTQFLTDQPAYAGMCYDPDNDRFLFYAGAPNGGSASGRVYVIKPNNTTTWDMSILSTTNAIPGGPTGGAGLHSRIAYVPDLKGVVCIPSSAAGAYFLRTA